MKVLFTETVETQEAHPQRFEAGKVYDLSDRSANHWISRNKARRLEAGEEGGPPPVQSLTKAEQEQVERFTATATPVTAPAEPLEPRQLRDDGSVKGASKPNAATSADIKPEPKKKG